MALVRISKLFGQGRPVYSFEFFPPKDEAAADELLVTVGELQAAHSPDFISVTYGAGGSTRSRTLECVTRIQKTLGITAMAHLACMGHTKAEIGEVARGLVAGGIENILALRGDPPKSGAAVLDPEMSHATDLIRYLKGNFDVDIGGACYPEVHLEAASADDDLRWAKEKVACGARFLITQLFFDTDDYFSYVEKARAVGIMVPIIPGIMPITNAGQPERFKKLGGSKIPVGLQARIDKYREEPAIVMAIGMEHAILQCKALLAGGAPGLHFYTLNKSHATRCILAALR